MRSMLKKIPLLLSVGCFGVVIMSYFDMRASARAGDTAMTVAEGFSLLANFIAGLYLLNWAGDD